MASTLLQLVRTFCARKALPRPSAVAGSSDMQVVQLQALVDKTVDYLVENYPWQDLIREAHFTTVAGEDQGSIATIAPNGFTWVHGGTIYNRTLRLPIYGPITNRQWQGLKALPAVGPFYKYRIRQRRLLFNPEAIAGHECYFEYQSSLAIRSGTLAHYTADNDTSIFPDSLMLLGLEYYWLLEKGLDYAEQLAEFDLKAQQFAARDEVKPILSLDSDATDWRPGIFVPSGNWPLS